MKEEKKTKKQNKRQIKSVNADVKVAASANANAARKKIYK